MLVHALMAAGILPADMNHLHQLLAELVEILSLVSAIVWRVEKITGSHNDKMDVVHQKIDAVLEKVDPAAKAAIDQANAEEV